VSLGDSLRGLKEFVGKRLLDKIGVDFGNYLNWENNSILSRYNSRPIQELSRGREHKLDSREDLSDI